MPTSRFEPLSYLLVPGPSTACVSYKGILKAALSSYGNLGRDQQRIRGFFSGMVRVVSNPREGSKSLTHSTFGPDWCAELAPTSPKLLEEEFSEVVRH